MNTESRARQGLVAGLFVVAFLLGIGYVAWLSDGFEGQKVTDPGEVTSGAVSPSSAAEPTPTPRATRTPKPSPTPTAAPRPWRVGVVAGHWMSDSGAVCPDGLQEVSINLDVATRVVALLQSAGVDAELLPEFAKELNGYKADVFVSIHADSCEAPGVSGFKVARVTASAIPETEDRLVSCLMREYGDATGLPFHANTVTFDMRGYHAFNEIDPQTPGAIIELGFMDADRMLLTENSSLLAQAVARGIACFLEGQ